MERLNETKTMKTLYEIERGISQKEPLDSSSFDRSKTVLVNVDMINGFCRFGALYSPRNEKLIEKVQRTNAVMADFKKIFFIDRHNDRAEEFGSYPPHCTDDRESSIVEELKEFLGSSSYVFEKNSTNGFFSQGFKEWFEKNPRISTYVVTGDCTDICVMTFALSLKTYCNQQDRYIDIIVPVDSVETFDLDATNHYGDLMNIFALYNMEMNGIRLVKTIK